jgi:hypothetical protein
MQNVCERRRFIGANLRGRNPRSLGPWRLSNEPTHSAAMMVEAGEIPAICLRFASPMMISLSLGCKVRYAVFGGRSMQRSEPTRCAINGLCPNMRTDSNEKSEAVGAP